MASRLPPSLYICQMCPSNKNDLTSKKVKKEEEETAALSRALLLWPSIPTLVCCFSYSFLVFPPLIPSCSSSNHPSFSFYYFLPPFNHGRLLRRVPHPTLDRPSSSSFSSLPLIPSCLVLIGPLHHGKLEARLGSDFRLNIWPWKLRCSTMIRQTILWPATSLEQSSLEKFSDIFQSSSWPLFLFSLHAVMQI